MSRIGKKTISVPSGVTVTVQPTQVTVAGPKGSLVAPLFEGITVAVADALVTVSRTNEEIQTRAYHGLVRSLIACNIKGVTEGYKKTLKLVGTGYRVTQKGAGLSLAVGYSHPVDVAAMPGITLKVEGNDTIAIDGIDKQLVGQVAADIRAIRPPEPYKGKGVRYENEVVKTKPGKTAAS